MKRKTYIVLAGIWMACSIAVACNNVHNDYKGWQVYGGSKENNHYSAIRQIDTGNVSQLKLAWTFRTGDADTVNHTQIQCNPIVIEGTMYGTSAQLKLFALDAETGKLRWMFNPADISTGSKKTSFNQNNCRGVTYWSDGKGEGRIFYAAGSYLNCVDAKTGKLVSDFGSNGKLDLHSGLGDRSRELYVAGTSPGIIYKDMIVIGTRVDEGATAAPGHIRAFDVKTGALRWIFHTIPQPGEPGYDSWKDTAAYRHIGGANAWSGFSMDEKRGVLYAATGSASYDFYGGKRLGNDLYADCLLAIDAASGKLIWHFQDIHHDVWDKDLPAPPALLTINRNGKKVDVVAQVTKTGFVFVFDRDNGKPVYPIVEKPVNHATELKGEELSPSQPFPLGIEPFTRQRFTAQDINQFLPPDSYREIQQRLAKYKNGFIFTPPSTQGTVIFPGFDGGAEWGGPAADPETGLLYVNANEMPWVLTMVDVKQADVPGQSNLDAGKALYTTHCMSCHGPNRQGSGNFPSLLGVEKKYDELQFGQLLAGGRRMMPSFKHLSAEEQKAIASFILDKTVLQRQPFVRHTSAELSYRDLPYTSTGYNRFVSKEGWPAINPPWGTLNAINLNTGKLVWRDTLGTDQRFPLVHCGTENYGGSVVTAGGLLCIAATPDSKFRIYNKRTGKLLKELTLPAPGFATPAVYEIKGKQYIVIACGGGKLKTKSHDEYVAFSL